MLVNVKYIINVLNKSLLLLCFFVLSLTNSTEHNTEHFRPVLSLCYYMSVTVVVVVLVLVHYRVYECLLLVLGTHLKEQEVGVQFKQLD